MRHDHTGTTRIAPGLRCSAHLGCSQSSRTARHGKIPVCRCLRSSSKRRYRKRWQFCFHLNKRMRDFKHLVRLQSATDFRFKFPRACTPVQSRKSTFSPIQTVLANSQLQSSRSLSTALGGYHQKHCAPCRGVLLM